MKILAVRFSHSHALLAALLLAGALIFAACGSGGGGSSGGDGNGSTPAAKPVFVDASAAGAEDGSSWSDAFTTVQAGVDAASSGEQVWVKQDTYRAASANASVLTMKDGVAVYGGFAGTETALAERSTDPSLTVLSGDFDTSGTFSATDSYHVVVGASNARLDGFTVSAGNAVGSNPTDRGGGMHNDSISGLEIANVTFSANGATFGGGMYNINASNPVLSEVTFSANTAPYGGGMFNKNSSGPVLTNVTFSANSATVDGGGMYNQFSSSPVLSEVTFSANTAGNNGGGMYNFSASSPVLTNVTFSINWAATNGGGINNNSSSPVLTNVTFSANTAAFHGGGMFNYQSFPVLTNVAFWGNTGTGPDVFNETSTPMVAYTCAEQDLSGYSATNVLLTGSPFQVAASGEIFLDQSSPCVNAGLDLAADDPVTGFTALGLPHWSALTTGITGTPLDEDGPGPSDVDAGRHYDPAQAWILDIAAGPYLVFWANHQATACEITNSADAAVITVAAGDLDVGWDFHGQASGTTLTLTCLGAVGLPAVAEAVVP